MKDTCVRLNVKVRPGAGRNEITGFTADVLNVKISAQPEKGKANEALVKYLSDILGIAKSRIEILKGATSRNKQVSIRGINPEDITSLLTASIKPENSHRHSP